MRWSVKQDCLSIDISVASHECHWRLKPQTTWLASSDWKQRNRQRFASQPFNTSGTKLNLVAKILVRFGFVPDHFIDVIMTTAASQITSLTIVYLIVYSGADQIKHQSSASLAFVRGIHRDRWIPRTKDQLRGKCFHLMTWSCCLRGTRRWPAVSLHKGPVMRRAFLHHGFIMPDPVLIKQECFSIDRVTSFDLPQLRGYVNM